MEKVFDGKNNHERTEELLEILRNFRLLDDTFFSECFDGSNECTELILRIILDMPDLKVLRTNTQRSVKNLMLHEARLDAYAEDSRGNAYDIEVQRSDTGAEIRRARFYSSMLDSRMLRKGFICNLHHGERRDEEREFRLQDRTLYNGYERGIQGRFAYSVCERIIQRFISDRASDA